MLVRLPRFVLVLLVALFVGMYGIGAADPVVKSAVAVGETLHEGQTIVGVRLEYPGEVNAADIDYASTFSANGYSIVGTFVNNDGVWGHAEVRGKYVFLMFGTNPVPGAIDGHTLLRFSGLYFALPVNMVVRQDKLVTLADGAKVHPAGIAVTDKINLIADDFLELSYIDATGFEVKYRLFVPPGYETKKADLKNLPLVIFFHGGASAGKNNDLQVLSNPSAIEFAKPEAQAKHPCFVMAPQSPFTVADGGLWAKNIGTKENPKFGYTPALAASLEALRKEIMAKYNVDAKRIYGTGLSQGSRAIWLSSMKEPDLYAAQLNIASADSYSDEEAKSIVNKPIWTLVSADDRADRVKATGTVVEQLERLGAKVNRKVGNDGFNGYLRGYAANLQAKQQWDEAKAQGANLMLTHIIPGTVKSDPHSAWVYCYNNEVLRDWLFSHSK